MKWQHFDYDNDASAQVDNWHWRERGEPPPTGKWWIRYESLDELRVSYSGDPQGELPTTTIGITRSNRLAGFEIHLEFSVYGAMSQIGLLAKLMRRAHSWLGAAEDDELAFQDFYDAANGFSGGCIVLSRPQGVLGVDALIWSRGEEYELRYRLGASAVAALAELAEYAAAWQSEKATGTSPR